MEEIFLNITPTGNRPVCHVSQYDIGRQIKVNLFDDTTAYHLQAGDALVLSVKKPNGENISANLNVSTGLTYAYIVTAEEMCDIVGRNECELRLKNGSKNIGTLNFYMQVEEAIEEGETLADLSPSIAGFYSMNAGTAGTLSHTFSNSGTYQYIVCLRLGDGQTLVDPTISINGTPLSPNTDTDAGGSANFYYGEVTVNAGDIITAENTESYGNSGFQMAILQNTKTSAFSIVGFITNTGRTFELPKDKWLFQVFKCGYYDGENVYSYMLQKYSTYQNGENIESIPTPDRRPYYYGFTYAITMED